MLGVSTKNVDSFLVAVYCGHLVEVLLKRTVRALLITEYVYKNNMRVGFGCEKCNKGILNYEILHFNHLITRDVLFASGFETWSAEVLFKFRKNNNKISISSPVVNNIITYRYHWTKNVRRSTIINSRYRSWLFNVFSTAQCGFSRDEKRTPVAREATLRASTYLCKALYAHLFPQIRVRFSVPTKTNVQCVKSLKTFGLGFTPVFLHSLVYKPISRNETYKKYRGRMRIRYHKYTYKRFKLIIKSNRLHRRGEINLYSRFE